MCYLSCHRGGIRHPARLGGGDVTAPESKKARLAAARAEFEKVRGAALVEFAKLCDPALAEYIRKRRAIEAEP